MAKLFATLQAFLEAHKGEDYFGTKNADGTVTDNETLEAHKEKHPEGWYPVINGKIVGTIPFDPGVFGKANEDGEIVVPSGKQVEIIETGNDDALVLCSDGCGNEWYERK